MCIDFPQTVVERVFEKSVFGFYGRWPVRRTVGTTPPATLVRQRPLWDAVIDVLVWKCGKLKRVFRCCRSYVVVVRGSAENKDVCACARQECMRPPCVARMMQG